MKLIGGVIVGVFACVHALGQTGSISGSVLMGDSLTAIQGVNVYLDQTGLATATNGSGYFKLADVPAGKYTLVFSSVGFKEESRVIEVVPAKSQEVNVVLTESVVALDNVVIITKGSNALKGVPGSVQYISPKELQKFQYTDATRALRLAPGVNMREEDGFGLRPNIGLRGTGVERSAKITLMEDGVLTAPAPYAEASAYYFPTMGRMHAIEILKGSSQIKYGPYTTGGAINFISTPIPESLTAHVRLSAGNFGLRNVHAFAGNSHEHVAYLFETFQYTSAGFKELDNNGNTGFTKSDYLAKVRFNTGAEARRYQSLTIKAAQTSEQSNETYLGLTLDDFNATPYRRYAASQLDNMEATQQQYSLTHDIEFNKQFSLTTTAYATLFKRNWYKLNNVTDSLGTKYALTQVLESPATVNDAYAILTGANSTLSNALTIRANNRDYFARGVQTQLNYRARFGMWKHDAAFGLRVHRDGVDRFQWDDVYAMEEGIMELTQSGTPGTESNRIKTAEALAAYIQYQLGWGKWTIVPGLRYESIQLQEDDYGKTDPDRVGTDMTTLSNSIAAFVPGIGIDYALEKSTHVFAGVHAGFGPPGVTPDTDAERSINYEAGIRYSKGAALLHATAFVNDYSNLLGTDMTSTGGAGTGDQFNAGEVLTAGLEIQAGYDLCALQPDAPFSIPVVIAYTFTDSRFSNDFDAQYEDWGEVQAGDIFPYQSAHQLNGLIGLSYRKLAANVNLNYISSMRTTPGQGQIDATLLIPARTVIDAGINYTVNPNWCFFANVMNIADNVYLVSDRPAGYRPGLPRTFQAGMKLDF